jgi:hypothetical protein
MTLHNYIRRRLYDDVTFTEFDCNPNFVPDNILPDVVACLRSHGNCSSCWKDFVRDGIVDNLMKK